MDKYKTIRRMIEKECQRTSLADLCEYWGVTCDDFDVFLYNACRAQPEITGETSDGYHTFNELYHHRAVLFSVICNSNPELAWKSKLHHDGTMYDGMFIVGIETPDGQATYHYDIDPYWEMFSVQELPQAPEWDGHTPAQAIERIGKLIAQPENEALTCDGCEHDGSYENEREYGYPSPCTKCKRVAPDNYRHKPERSEG